MPSRSERPLPAPAERPAIWTVSLTRLSRLIAEVTPEFDGRAQISPIPLGFEEAVTRIQQRLRREPCDVIIAAGSNGAYLVNRVPRPVVQVQATGFDLLQALARARQVSDRIGVLTHQSDLPEFAAFRQSFGLDIEQRRFLTAEDARDAVAGLIARGVRVVVGTGLAVELAEQAGATGILLYSAETIRQAFETALRLVEAAGGAGPGRAARAPGRPSRPLPSEASLVGDHPLMQQLRARIRDYAASEATVLLQGATGTGKEAAARALHAASARAGGPFVAVNCAALSESLLESELFGHEEGAFTGARRGGRRGLIETASGGSLFLDEIGDMPASQQTRLLRVLEERELTRVGGTDRIRVDLRVIAATHQDLAAAVAAGRFRRDLYYRLNVLRIALPRLSEHAQDLPGLLAELLRRLGHPGVQAPAAVWRQLRGYAWPGNVRELRNLAERLVAEEPAARQPRRLSLADLERLMPELLAPPAPTGGPLRGRPPPAELQRLLTEAGGERGVLAQRLGVSRSTLWRWLRERPRAG
ncbi:MAG TPA: propionate catabolism operon regulatory protein PrpR [Nevskiaceae bacterium]|nr:propionate catabolism operon regulatory protein PrpR [Nevskiaceae bacterium]